MTGSAVDTLPDPHNRDRIPIDAVISSAARQVIDQEPKIFSRALARRSGTIPTTPFDAAISPHRA